MKGDLLFAGMEAAVALGGVAFMTWFVRTDINIRRDAVAAIRQRTADQQPARPPNWDEVIRSVIGCRRVFGGAAANVYRAPGFDLDALVRRLVAIAVTAPDEKTAAMMVEHQLSKFEATDKPPRPNAGEPKESTMDTFYQQANYEMAQAQAKAQAAQQASPYALRDHDAPGLATDSALDEMARRVRAITDQLHNACASFSSTSSRVFGYDKLIPTTTGTAGSGVQARPQPPGALGVLEAAIDGMAEAVTMTCGYTHVMGKL